MNPAPAREWWGSFLPAMYLVLEEGAEPWGFERLEV